MRQGVLHVAYVLPKSLVNTSNCSPIGTYSDMYCTAYLYVVDM